MLREGMTCARSHTKKWHRQDFNQVRLPRADFPERSCSSVLSPHVRGLAAEGASWPVLCCMVLEKLLEASACGQHKSSLNSSPWEESKPVASEPSWRQCLPLSRAGGMSISMHSLVCGW